MAIKRSAQLASAAVVASDFEGDAPRILHLVTIENRPSDSVFTQQLEHFHEQLYGMSASEEWLVESRELWIAVDAEAGPMRAWSAVISVAWCLEACCGSFPSGGGDGIWGEASAL